MRRCLAAGATAAAFLAGAGTTASAQAPAPQFNWSGFYIGAHIGRGWDDDNVHWANANAGLAPHFANGVIPSQFATRADGTLGGAQTGFNWQFANWVFGLEGDFSFGEIDGTHFIHFNARAPFTAGDSFSTKHLQEFGTVRARLGAIAFDNWLFYSTGGLAYGDASVTATQQAAIGCGPAGICDNATVSKWLWGWTLGGGLEYALGRNWSAKVEYLYYDLGKIDFTMQDATTGAISAINVSTDFRGSIVRFGVNYKFSGR